MPKKFIAKLYQRYEDGTWHELLQKALAVDTEKQEFNIGNRSFVADFHKVAYYSKGGLPVLSYYLENPIPLTEKLPQALEQLTNSSRILQETTNQSGKTPSSSLFDKMFRRNMIAAILMASTKQVAPVAWYIYLALGAMIGFVAGDLANPYIAHATAQATGTTISHLILERLS